jgi:MFS family permease
VNGVAIPFFGRLADLYGVDRLFGVGLATFFLGSLLCVLAPSFVLLMAGRLVQGVGGAAAVGLGVTALSLAYGPEIRGRAIGFVVAAVGVGAAAGPPLGALAPLAPKVLPRGATSSERRLDLPGGLFFALALGGALLALTEGASGGALFLASAGVAVAAIAGFVYRQATAPVPFVPRALLDNGSYVWLCAATLLLVGAMPTVEVGVPLPLAQLEGLGATRIGLVLLPAAVLTIFWGPASGGIVDRFGVAGPVALGAAVSAAAVALLSGVGVGGPPWVVGALVVVVGAGVTLAKISLLTGVSLTVPEANLPSGIAVNEMVWVSGISIGTAFFSAVAAARADATESLNPLHTGPGAGYSDAFLALAFPLLLVILVSLKLGRKARERGG